MRDSDTQHHAQGSGASWLTVVALVLIRRGESVLLVRQRRSGYWSLPGGKVERGESLDRAAIRETREETGLDVRLGRVVGLYSQPAVDELIVTFEAEVVNGAWHLGTDEIAGCAYFTMASLPAAVRPELRVRIDDFLRGDPAAVVRRL